MGNDISLIALLAFSTLLPFIIASGTCFVKFSIVFVMVRNALGLQQIPSNMTLNGVALLLSMFVMWPIMHDAYVYFEDEDGSILVMILMLVKMAVRQNLFICRH